MHLDVVVYVQIWKCAPSVVLTCLCQDQLLYAQHSYFNNNTTPGQWSILDRLSVFLDCLYFLSRHRGLLAAVQHSSLWSFWLQLGKRSVEAARTTVFSKSTFILSYYDMAWSPWKLQWKFSLPDVESSGGGAARHVWGVGRFWRTVCVRSWGCVAVGEREKLHPAQKFSSLMLFLGNEVTDTEALLKHTTRSPMHTVHKLYI